MILVFIDDGITSLQSHTADRTAAGRITNDLGMHGTGVSAGPDCGLGGGSDRWFDDGSEISYRLGIELSFASVRTEEIGRSSDFGSRSSTLRVDLHSTYRIDHVRCEF